MENSTRMCIILLSILLLSPVYSLSAGTVSSNNLFSFPVTINGTSVATKLVLDANWHWVHAAANSSQNCFPGYWNTSICNTPAGCNSLCAIQGIPTAQWNSTYGITGSAGSVTLKYVTGSNVGSRVYLTSANGQTYYGLNLLDQQLKFTVDTSKAGCGLAGTLYFVEMPLNGGGVTNMNNSNASLFGLGYCDAQCPSPKIVKGKATGVPGYYSYGACCTEFDAWQSNSQAASMATHHCNTSGLYDCGSDVQCGRNGNPRPCNQGNGYNPYQQGNTTFYGYGTGFSIDTSKPFTVSIKFITNNGLPTGNLTQVKRSFIQNGVTYNEAILTNNLQIIGDAFKRKMTMVLSLWDDVGSQMLWLDGVYPVGSTVPTDKRGPCAANSGDTNTLRATVPNSTVTFSAITITSIP